MPSIFRKGQGNCVIVEWLSLRTLTVLCKSVRFTGWILLAEVRNRHILEFYAPFLSCVEPGVCVSLVCPLHHESSVSVEVSETPDNCSKTIILALFHYVSFPAGVFIARIFFSFLCRLHAPWAGATFSILSCLLLLPNERWNIILKMDLIHLVRIHLQRLAMPQVVFSLVSYAPKF